MSFSSLLFSTILPSSFFLLCSKCFLTFSYFLNFHVAEVDFFWFLVLFRLILVLILALLWPQSFLFWLRWPGFACICNMIQPLLVLAGNSNRLYCMSASDKPITLHLHYNCWSIHLFPPPAIMLEVFFCARTRKPLSDATCSAVFVCGREYVSQPPRNKEGVHSKHSPLTEGMLWKSLFEMFNTYWLLQFKWLPAVRLCFHVFRKLTAARCGATAHLKTDVEFTNLHIESRQSRHRIKEMLQTDRMWAAGADPLKISLVKSAGHLLSLTTFRVVVLQNRLYKRRTPSNT